MYLPTPKLETYSYDLRQCDRLTGPHTLYPAVATVTIRIRQPSLNLWLINEDRDRQN